MTRAEAYTGPELQTTCGQRRALQRDDRTPENVFLLGGDPSRHARG